MKENKIRNWKKEREEERPGSYKDRERAREKGREERPQGWGLRLQKPLAVHFLHICQDLSIPTSLRQTSWNPRALQCSLPLRCQLFSCPPTCPEPGPLQRPLFLLSERTTWLAPCLAHWLQIVSEGVFSNGFSLSQDYSRNVNSFRLE